MGQARTDLGSSAALWDFVNGSAAGVGICLSGHSFDTVKVRMQTNTRLSFRQVISHTYRQEGMAGFYRGIRYPLITVPVINAIIFGSYEYFKRLFSVKNELLSGVVCGAFAGLANSFLLSPIELVKCKMQIQHNSALYSSSWDCLVKTYRHQGFSKGVMKGTVPTILREVFAYIGQFGFYESSKLYFTGGKRQLTPFENLLSGGFAGIGCWLLSYPQDIIKTKIQVSEQFKQQYQKQYFDGGFLACYRQILRQKGYKGLWVGLTPCMIRAVVANSFGFLIYQQCKKINRPS